MTAIFLRTKLDPFNVVLLDNWILTVFELYLSELLKELLRQLRHEASVQFAWNQRRFILNKKTN